MKRIPTPTGQLEKDSKKQKPQRTSRDTDNEDMGHQQRKRIKYLTIKWKW